MHALEQHNGLSLFRHVPLSDQQRQTQITSIFFKNTSSLINVNNKNTVNMSGFFLPNAMIYYKVVHYVALLQ